MFYQYCSLRWPDVVVGIFTLVILDFEWMLFAHEKTQKRNPMGEQLQELRLHNLNTSTRDMDGTGNETHLSNINQYRFAFIYILWKLLDMRTMPVLITWLIFTSQVSLQNTMIQNRRPTLCFLPNGFNIRYGCASYPSYIHSENELNLLFRISKINNIILQIGIHIDMWTMLINWVPIRRLLVGMKATLLAISNHRHTAWIR